MTNRLDEIKACARGVEIANPSSHLARDIRYLLSRLEKAEGALRAQPMRAETNCADAPLSVGMAAIRAYFEEFGDVVK